MKFSKFLIVGVLVSFSMAKSAQAYIDPGAGSLALQALAAIGIGLLFYIRSIGQAIKNLFTRNSRKDSDNDTGGK